VWGTTFVSTKMLIQSGMTPMDIFLTRFVIAYVGLCLLAPKQLRAHSSLDEWLLVGLGITGGSLYFLTENMALVYSSASNVSLLVTTTPLLTLLALRLCGYTKRLCARQLWGAVLALSGVCCVVFNGHFVLQLNIRGDLLALCAALMWTLYSILLRRLGNRYDSRFLMRKVFFYGLLTALPVRWLLPTSSPLAWHSPIVWLNLLFLGLVASMICYLVWTLVMQRLGTMRATNYIYFNPVVTLLVATLVLDERLTCVAAIGAVAILVGVWLAQKTDEQEN
jgi:drug/metabolite transporter (DMT)-like permease